jgi:hypothetical protein
MSTFDGPAVARLNGVIDRVERGATALGTFAAAHPHVTEKNVDGVVAHGYRLLFTAPVVSHPGLAITGRS